MPVRLNSCQSMRPVWGSRLGSPSSAQSCAVTVNMVSKPVPSSFMTWAPYSWLRKTSSSGSSIEAGSMPRRLASSMLIQVSLLPSKSGSITWAQ